MNRRSNVKRYPSGQIHHTDRGEKPEQVLAVAKVNRFKHNAANDKDWDSPLRGYVVGRLFLGGLITKTQLTAARIFTQRFMSYARTVTGKVPTFPSAMTYLAQYEPKRPWSEEETPASQQSSTDEPLTEEERIATAIKQYEEIQSALLDHYAHPYGNQALTRLCILDKEPRSDDEMGNFRLACNAIAHRLRIG